MDTPDRDKEKALQVLKSKIQQQIAFTSGIFQGDVTIRTLLGSLAEGVVIIDNSGIILLVNTRAEQMFDYPKNELIGMPHDVLIPERFHKVHEEHEAHFFQEPRIRPMGRLLDLAGRRRDGSEFPVEISLGFIETINGVLVMALVSDMTLRKQYESRFRETEELFHIQVEGVKDYAIFMLDTEGNVLNWNAGAERLKGYTEKEIIGTHFSCFYSEEDRNAGKPEEDLKKANAEGRAVDEGWRIRKNGRRFWADVIITALYNESGYLRGFSMVSHDITGRKQAEDALRFSEARYRALFRDNPTMIVTLDTDLTMLSVNPSCASQLGYTIDELEGQPVLKLFHEDDRPAVIEQLHMCLQNPDQVNHWQFYKIRKDGGLLWVEETAQAVYGLNGALNVLIVCQDITERNRMEDALRESEERFRATFNQAAVGIGHVSPDGRWLRINQKCCDILGYTEEEFKALAIEEITHPDDLETSMQHYQLLLKGKLGSYSLEKRYIRKDGSTVWVNLTASMVFDAGGNPRFAVGIVEDITARKRAEEEIVRLNADLAARAADLEDVNRELEAFNYTVAHDLRQPLNVIGINCQAIDMLCGDSLSEECKGYVQGSYEGTLHINRMIEALLNFSRMGRVEPGREMVDLSAVAHEVATVLKRTEPERQVDFRIADGIVANGDASLLRVVLDNLIGNAWKYTSMRKKAVIEFGVTDIGGVPSYFVRDNGDGFEKANADKLFAPFQRLPGAEKCRGFGIGLATVERIIRRHGGSVWAEGEPGNGAIFYFTLGGDRTV